ncbi:ABC-2 type transport system ATP-binding protein [Pseudokineococcus lusitanus]|uniref:ABC-2 type transport system ATP-binding protein n=1 Tax=Pseudokineococcus lusitanus TaxID=763993 RepID=A0A3N1HQ17_9ACTN|nr:ABC-2 type transport system ATP-binding protein [Pseudokineococcus lusitanus]
MAHDVARSFRGRVAVVAADLVVPPGSVTALVGPNGAGKTTLLLVLAGLLAPDRGSVTLDGVDLVADPVGARARTGWMPDSLGSWDSLTARELLATMADAHRLPRAASAARVAELLALVHLEDLADAPAHVLSRGQKQRLGLARALVHSPAVLLLDEPASGLDPRSRVELRDTLRRLAGEGVAVLVSSHVLGELDELADRAVLMNGGRTVDVLEDVGVGGLGSDVPGSRPRPWRVRALEPAQLLAALEGRGLRPRPAEGGIDVVVPDEESAARLLAGLVADGVGVVSFAPATGLLEQAYLELDEGSRR